MYLGIALNGDLIEFMLINNKCEIYGFQEERMIDYDDRTNFIGAIESGIARICLKADMKFEDIDFTCIAIPEYGESQAFDEMMNGYFRDIFYHNHFICENEVEAAWLAALGGYEGIVILAGIGSIAIGKNAIGESVRVGGWGRVSGDEGGEYWLVKKMFEIFTKQIDGRYKRGDLYHQLKAVFNLTDDTDFYNFSFNKLEIYDVTFDDLIQVFFETAYSDPYVMDVLSACAEEYKSMIQAIQEKISLDQPIRVSYMGRIFEESRGLIQRIEGLLTPEYVLKKPFLKLVSGAALRALIFREKINYYDIHTLLKEEMRLDKLH
ncbi:hypothetical protein EZV73_17960 [Acidaminobacter sp. JC074]|uniref:BadF/BadG/BcrA/BcrD ATPase family protein n=1 Tax=Acidaminobacter sp. JC074 TaxID=2530199 RepID=UPI001F0E30B6|nr:BadF/BadG/BcrA/BcrD ATPase family protein [Acidaminobacter sp. JC074]MCH4889471.1 hypothetical protein [Acidaminobacter sp. JC074]